MEIVAFCEDFERSANHANSHECEYLFFAHWYFLLKNQISTPVNHQAWRTPFARVLFSPVHAEIFHQDLRLPDERARLGTGRAFARRARL